MGNRRIRLCKACGRKFTLKNQKPAETEEQARTEPGIQGEQDSAVSRTDVLPDEEPPPLLGALDRQWTS